MAHFIGLHISYITPFLYLCTKRRLEKPDLGFWDFIVKFWEWAILVCSIVPEGD